MAWTKVMQGEGGDTPVWIDYQTGAVSMTQPTSTAPNFQTRPTASGGLETLNPQSGRWEASYRLPGAGVSFVPDSIASQYPGSFLVDKNAPKYNSEPIADIGIPLTVGAITGMGLSGMAGVGPLASGSGATGVGGSNAALMDFLNADAASSAGLTGAGATGTGGAMDTSWFEPWADAATGGGADTSYLMNNFGNMADLGSGAIPVDPTANTAGISDFIKGAIQSGNISELAKVLPSIPGGTSALSKLLGGSSGTGGTGTSGSLWDMLGRAAPGLLGAYAANKQTNAMTDLANKFSEYGAPSRARYEASMTPGFDPTSIPGYQGALDTASQTLLRKLSATGGNPYGNPGGLIEANKQIVSGTALPAIQQYQNQNANTGGLGALAAAYPATQTAATQSGANVYNALGSAAGNVFNPPQTASQSLADVYKLINSGMKGV